MAISCYPVTQLVKCGEGMLQTTCSPSHCCLLDSLATCQSKLVRRTAYFVSNKPFDLSVVLKSSITLLTANVTVISLS